MVGPELGVYPGLLSSKAQAFYHFALPSPRIVGRAEDPVSRLSGFPVSSAGKEFSYYAGDPSSIPRSGRSPGEGISYPLQYSWSSLVAQLVKNPPAMWETWLQPWVGKIPWRRENVTYSSVLAWRIPCTV